MSSPDDWTISHFSQSNPVGPGQGDVPALLRRVADTVANLGDVDVQDITFQSSPAHEGNDLTMTVYFNRRSADDPVRAQGSRSH